MAKSCRAVKLFHPAAGKQSWPARAAMLLKPVAQASAAPATRELCSKPHRSALMLCRLVLAVPFSSRVYRSGNLLFCR